MSANKTAKAPARDPRLPAPGARIERKYKGEVLRITVLEDGFRLGKREFTSLSALARYITGAPSINGPLFFRLGAPAKAKAKLAAKSASKPKTKGA